MLRRGQLNSFYGGSCSIRYGEDIRDLPNLLNEGIDCLDSIANSPFDPITQNLRGCGVHFFLYHKRKFLIEMGDIVDRCKSYFPQICYGCDGGRGRDGAS
ncbi:unnamed protein product [Prunus armeniaca]|uniref:Uncharacterized protein n=1 Tax=Prunus armeniaca TaxID=36596 RepID=A0A6J5U8Y4_PRUAR|nr:unnamed protein product [Prunus armeniaca]